MNLLELLTFLLFFYRSTQGKPVQGIQENCRTGEADVPQDDIIHRRTPRSAISCGGSCYWPKSEDGLVIIPIHISTDFSMEQRAVIVEAMQEFATLTCIRFIRRTTQQNYIHVSPSDKCWSYFGKIGGRQELGLAKYGCIHKGLIQHELNHALGFLHEQVRSDRDKYVKINWENVRAGEHGNFEKVNSSNLGLPYDYDSVMHYGPYDFSNSAGKATIVPVPNASVQIGQRAGLSNTDVKKINKLYKCNHCGTVLHGPSGNFSSNIYSSSNSNKVTCVWLIRIPQEKVFLKFHIFNLQSSPNCVSNYIRIYDGIYRKARILVDRFCGVGQLPAAVASGSTMLVEFASDAATKAQDFTASYSPVKCGRTFTGVSGAITSPNFPRRYPPNQACLWIISAPPDRRISLKMVSFELEDIRKCRCDSLVLRDGSQNNSPLVGTFCGKMKFPAFNSTGSFLRIEFYTDFAFQFSGFKLEYSIS